MKTSIVPLEDVLSLAATSTSSSVSAKPRRLNIFATFGTAGCLLDCSKWQMRTGVKAQRATNTSDKRSKNKELADLGKTNVKIQRETIPQPDKGKHVANSLLAAKRAPFTASELEVSVANGCGSCRFFQTVFRGLQGALQVGNNENGLVYENLVFEWVGYDYFLMVKDNTDGPSGASPQSMSFQLFCPTGATTVVQNMRTANVLTGDTSLTTSFARAEKWIDTCAASHAQCGSGRDVPLPKRLVNLESIMSITKNPGIRLAITEGMIGTYACLSHCWGKDPMPVRTTSTTLADHLQFISWASLPKSFQDAVVIARRLGLHYLWIDSLCIVQDSGDDWQVESGKMAQIYQNGFVTIAAVSAADFRGGCFTPREKTKTSGDLSLRLQSDDKEDNIDLLVCFRNCHGDRPMTEAAQSDSHFPLFTRAWVYQERMLSRRILRSHHSELQFECRDSVGTCECGNRFLFPHPKPSTTASRRAQQTKDQYYKAMQMHLHHGGDRGRYSADQLTQNWQQTVAQYSRLALSYRSDILPALSGCARDMGRLLSTGDTYLAGLWRGSLAEGLLWTVEPPIDLPRPDVWAAPTWSWAGVHTVRPTSKESGGPTGIRYTHVPKTLHRQAFQDRIEAVECIAADVAADPTGKVTSGFLRLRTRTCPAYLRRICRRCQSARSRISYTVEHEQWYATRSASVTPCTFAESPGGRLDIAGGRLSFFPDFKYDDRTDFAFFDAEDGRACKLAPIALLHLYDCQGAVSEGVTDFFLVLRASKAARDTFERVALVSLTFPQRATRDTWFRDVHAKSETGEKIVILV